GATAWYCGPFSPKVGLRVMVKVCMAPASLCVYPQYSLGGAPPQLLCVLVAGVLALGPGIDGPVHRHVVVTLGLGVGDRLEGGVGSRLAAVVAHGHASSTGRWPQVQITSWSPVRSCLTLIATSPLSSGWARVTVQVPPPGRRMRAPGVRSRARVSIGASSLSVCVPSV